MKLKIVILLLITISISFMAVETMAGKVNKTAVSIDIDLMRASGSQTEARFSPNNVELIGCGIQIGDDGVNPVVKFGFCQATDANGVEALCTTDSPDLIEAINGISDYGFIQFHWNEQVECINIRNSTQSFYIPNFGLHPDRFGSDPTR